METIPTRIQDRVGQAVIYSMLKSSNSNCECEVCKAWRKLAKEFTERMEVV